MRLTQCRDSTGNHFSLNAFRLLACFKAFESKVEVLDSLLLALLFRRIHVKVPLSLLVFRTEAAREQAARTDFLASSHLMKQKVFWCEQF